jgi:hypothetical protein
MHRNTNHTSEITVRLADYTDARALLDLAALDSARVPAGALVVAESDGELVAAMPVDGGRPIADPFRGTSLIVQMLELRAAQIRSRTEHAHGIAGRVRSLAGLQPAA